MLIPNRDISPKQSISRHKRVQHLRSTATAGLGHGTLANRPATCTPQVGYWATDQGSWNQSGIGGQGQLFVCTAPNTWTLYYTPYTYPHPLIAGGIFGNGWEFSKSTYGPNDSG